jgi:hypothetical protein
MRTPSRSSSATPTDRRSAIFIVHDYPPILKQRLTKGETRRKVRGRGLYMSKCFLPAMATPASVSALS